MQNTDEKNDEQWAKNLEKLITPVFKFMHDEISMGDLEL